MLSLLQHQLLLLLLTTQVSIALTDVIWDSPSDGDVYIPGDTLQAVWTSPDKVISPSFTICTGPNSNTTITTNNTDCGTAVWPSVEQNGSEYSISLAIPNITRDGKYFLVMKDDRGTMYDTPNFSLALANNASHANTTITPNISQPGRTSITYVPSHSSSAAAAIAIPLSLVAAILLGALILFLYRARRSTQRKRSHERQLQISREPDSRLSQSNISFESASDLERAVWALSMNKAYGNAASTACGPSPMRMGDTAGRSLAAAASLGIRAFGWARGPSATGPTVPPITDAYTPAPVQRQTTSSFVRSVSRPHSTHWYHDGQEKPRLPTDWIDTDWRSSQQTFSEQLSRHSGPPQLPAIQIYAGSLAAQADVSPPLPQKQLFPGRLDIHAPRAYPPPYGSSLLMSNSHLPPTPGIDAHPSLNVISNYLHASPALPQAHHFCSNDEHASEPSVPNVSLPSMMHGQYHHLETFPEREEKPLPLRPEDRVGMDL